MLNVDHGNPVTFKVDHDIDKKIFSTYVNDKILDMFNLAKTIKPIPDIHEILATGNNKYIPIIYNQFINGIIQELFLVLIKNLLLTLYIALNRLEIFATGCKPNNNQSISFCVD